MAKLGAERGEWFEALRCAEETSCFHGLIVGGESLVRDLWIVLPGKH